MIKNFTFTFIIIIVILIKLSDYEFEQTDIISKMVSVLFDIKCHIELIDFIYKIYQKFINSIYFIKLNYYQIYLMLLLLLLLMILTVYLIVIRNSDKMVAAILSETKNSKKSNITKLFYDMLYKVNKIKKYTETFKFYFDFIKFNQEL